MANAYKFGAYIGGVFRVAEDKESLVERAKPRTVEIFELKSVGHFKLVVPKIQIVPVDQPAAMVDEDDDEDCERES